MNSFTLLLLSVIWLKLFFSFGAVWIHILHVFNFRPSDWHTQQSMASYIECLGLIVPSTDKIEFHGTRVYKFAPLACNKMVLNNNNADLYMDTSSFSLFSQNTSSVRYCSKSHNFDQTKTNIHKYWKQTTWLFYLSAARWYLFQSYLVSINNAHSFVAINISSPHSAEYMRQWIGSALVQIMAWRLFGAKPSSKSVLKLAT